MKGYLHKTEEGWVVIYDQRTMQDPSAEDGILPLHTDIENIAFYNGKEVEFEIFKYDGKTPISNGWNSYAKLITLSEHKPDPHFGQIDMNGDPLKYWGGLAKEVTFEEINNQSINYPEISDDEIKNAAIKYAYHIPYENPLSDFMEGARWYRQQLKQK